MEVGGSLSRIPTNALNGLEDKIYQVIEDKTQHAIQLCDYVLTGLDHLGNKTLN